MGWDAASAGYDFDSLAQGPDGAAKLLAAYCLQRSRAWGPQLLKQLAGVRGIPVGVQTMGIGGGALKALGRPFGRLLGISARVLRFGRVSAGPERGNLNRLAQRMTSRDLRAAARELKGEVVKRKADGTRFDHVTKVQNAQNGLMNVINRCNARLRNPKLEPPLTPAKRAAYTADLERATRMLELTKKFVPRGRR